MKRYLIKEIFDLQPGIEVEVRGWVRSKRVSKACAFLIITDGSCHSTLQCVVSRENQKAFSVLDEIATGASVAVRGKLVESRGQGQSVEIDSHDVELMGTAGEDYPLQKKGHSLEFLREIPHLRPRTNTLGAVMRVRHELSMATHDFFAAENFYWVHTPILTCNDGEGAGEMFQVTNWDLSGPVPRRSPETQTNVAGGEQEVDYSCDFFHKKTHLTVTGQLEAEFLALSLGRVYTFGPTFRAENSHTRRHLAEFWMIEPEIAFADRDECLKWAGRHFQFMLRRCLERCSEELDFFAKFYRNISVEELRRYASTDTIPQITYTEALEILAGKHTSLEVPPPEWGQDLSVEHELFLAEKYAQGPLWVVDYPRDIRAFYMRANDDGKTVACMDLLVPGVGELIGGSAREERLSVLESRMSPQQFKDLRWYRDLRKYGSVPHGGYGLGLERMVAFVTGMKNVRDTIPCPRTAGNIHP